MNKVINQVRTINIISKILDPTMHKKRLYSIGNAVFGALYADRLMISKIGRSLSNLRGSSPKHSIKAVDRLIGNPKFNLQNCFQFYTPWIVAKRRKIVVTLDWTEFCYTGHQTLSINLLTKHGRATPLLWKSYEDSELKNNMVRFEMALLAKLKSLVPATTNVIVLADRGFSNTTFFRFIERELCWHYIIRVKSNMYVYDKSGNVKKASEWVPRNGRILALENAMLTRKTRAKIGMMVFVKKRGMKEAWHLATTLQNRKGEAVNLYHRRFTCEENFRDLKDDKFGSGFRETLVTSKSRKDRLILIHALSVILLTILGSVGEKLGYDRQLRANTATLRTHSLYRQGREYVKGIMDAYYIRFKRKFTQVINNHKHSKIRFGII